MQLLIVALTSLFFIFVAFECKKYSLKFKASCQKIIYNITTMACTSVFALFLYAVC